VKGVVAVGVSLASAAAPVGMAIPVSAASMLGAGGSAPGVSAAATATIRHRYGRVRQRTVDAAWRAQRLTLRMAAEGERGPLSSPPSS
jgi:hypothetical protein